MGGGGTHPSRRLGDERGASTADPDVCNQSRERPSDPSRDRGREDSPRAEKLSFVVAVRGNRRSPAPLWHGGLSLSQIMGRPAIHPGEHLADLLHELDMSAAELSRQLKVPTNRVTAITQVALTRRERLIPQFPSASLRFLLP